MRNVRAYNFKMKNINKIIYVVFVLLIGIVIEWHVKGEHMETIFTTYLPALATLMAAYFGAKYAFDLQSNKEKETLKQRNIINGNLAIFNILRMINNLLNYQRQIIDPVRDKPTAFLEMSPTLPSEKDVISLNIESLSFLLEIVEPNILGELTIQESRYQRAIDAIQERTRVHRDEAQPILEMAGISTGTIHSFEEIETALGERLHTTLQQSTKQIIEHVDDTIISLQEVGNKLSQILQELYPKEKIIKISVPEQQGTGKP
jgi:hypothetical protein